MKAEFEQDKGGWGKTLDFNSYMGSGNPNDPNSAYDLNGNIKRMQQWGWTPQNVIARIDSLTYTYSNGSTANQTFSNKLLAVYDQSTVTGLGDFESRNNSATDYVYDGNGNMTKDYNKRIGKVGTTAAVRGITYNHLNLPDTLFIFSSSGTAKGRIYYLYDANGQKLRKTVVENSIPVVVNGVTYTTHDTTFTHYLGGMVYQSKNYSNSTVRNNLRYRYQLQFFGHEEGRVRAVRATPKSNLDNLVYDYMLKDHLGNVRMVLTEQMETTQYTPLTFQGSQGSAESNNQNQVWENANGQSININGVNITSPMQLQTGSLFPVPLDSSMLVRSSTGKVGAGKLIKVMAGDRIHTSVQYYYPTVGTQPVATGLNTLLGGLGSVISNSAGAGGLLKTASSTLAQGVGLDPLALSFFTNQNSSSSPDKPKAYLNVLFFDEQFNIVASASKYQQVGTGTMNPNSPGQIGFMAGSAALAQKSGYCYIYISNESDDLVYFDNFTLSHERSSLIEETHYYPFGLTMAGISSKAAGKGIDCGCGNKKGYNGNEIQAKEFSDGSGLDVYDFNARTYDQQIGRFIQIDPLTEEAGQDALTPYHFSGNNPSTFNDPDGKCPWCLILAIPGVKETIPLGVAAVGTYVIKEVSQALTPVITDAIMKTEAPTLPNLNAPTADANAFIPLSAQMAKAKVEKSTNEKPAPTFDGQQDTESATPREAFRKAKEQNAIPRSQQPDRTIKPNTPEGDDRGLDSRNVKQYEFDKNSKGQKVVIRQDKEAIYPTGPPQPPHFNAGQNPQTPKDASQHHNVITPFSYFINRIRH